MALTAERQRWYRQRKGVAVHNYLLNHPCVDCGESDPIVLDFDHVRGEKRHNVKRMLAGTYSLSAVMDEIEKCEVRCANCHRRITAKRGGFFAYLESFVPRPERVNLDKCGTRTGYRQGCRCTKCKEAQRVAAERLRKKKAEAP